MWDPKPLIATLATQVGERIGEPDGVLVFDLSAVPKKGPKSVGLARQWCRRLRKTDNCPFGVFLGYVVRSDHTLVDVRLYLHEEWTRTGRGAEERPFVRVDLWRGALPATV